MSYAIGQYVKNNVDNHYFMTILKDGNAKIINDIASTNAAKTFNDSCLYISNNTLYKNQNYYCHCQIRKMSTVQKFKIKLLNYDNKKDIQFVKSITINSGSVNEWVDVEFIFNPIVDCNTIVFELERVESDYQTARVPVILYQELSLINNLVNIDKLKATSLLKIGIQANPGFLMCINNEEIRVGNTGIYEIKKGNVIVTFFSAISGCSASNANITSWRQTAVNKSKDGGYFTGAYIEESNRNIDTFTLDYLYKEV